MPAANLPSHRACRFVSDSLKTAAVHLEEGDEGAPSEEDVRDAAANHQVATFLDELVPRLPADQVRCMGVSHVWSAGAPCTAGWLSLLTESMPGPLGPQWLGATTAACMLRACRCACPAVRVRARKHARVHAAACLTKHTSLYRHRRTRMAGRVVSLLVARWRPALLLLGLLSRSSRSVEAGSGLLHCSLACSSGLRRSVTNVAWPCCHKPCLAAIAPVS